MDSETRPSFYPNTLQPAEISKENLERILKDLQLAVKNSLDIIRKNYQVPPDASAYGNVYSGIPGIVLSLLRLERQKSSIQLEDDQNKSHDDDYAKYAFDLIMQTPTDIEITNGRMSPLGSASAPSFMRILASFEQVNLQLKNTLTPATEDFAFFTEVIERATRHGHFYSFRGFTLGGDELLFGRAGLLWALLTLEKHSLTEASRDSVTARLTPALQNVPKLVDAIISAGKQGSRDYVNNHGPEDAQPLMYQWMDGYYVLGAVHGTTGILTMLLSCDLKDDQFDLIAETITALCRICIKNGGHFPMSIPERPDNLTRSSPLVQLCHGPPGLLILLGAVYRKTWFIERFWRPDWDVAIKLATEKIWQEGLLSKGGNLCHGITGNAWPLLSLHNVYEYHGDSLQRAKQKRMAALEQSESFSTEKGDVLSADFFLSRALPFMMLARETPPYSQEVDIKTTFEFRRPDRPYCLGEGLMGQVCAWAETCAVIKARLRKMELESSAGANDFSQDEKFIEYTMQQLGFPAMVVNGPDTDQVLLGSLCQEGC